MDSGLELPTWWVPSYFVLSIRPQVYKTELIICFRSWLTSIIAQCNASYSLYDFPSSLFHVSICIETVIQEYVMCVLSISFPYFSLNSVIRILLSYWLCMILILQTWFLLKIFFYSMLFHSALCFRDLAMLLHVNLVHYFRLFYSISSYACNTLYIPAAVVMHSYVPTSICYPQTT